MSSIIKFKDDNGNNYPDWIIQKVKDLFEITRGCVLAADNVKTSRDQTHPYPVYSSQTKNNGLMGYYDKFLYENAITWTTDGANAGTVNFREGKFYCTNVCGVLLNKDGYANKCIAEIIGCISKRYVSYVGNPKLMNNVMSEIPILIPCLKEQEKIASFLTSIDNLISTQESNISILETYNRGLISKIFKQEIRFKDDNGNEFPDWEEKNLIEVCNFINGKAHENAIEEKGTYIVVNSKFISSDGTVKKYSNAQIVPLYKNDIVMVMSDVPNGKAIAKCYLIDCDNKFTLNQRICALRTNQNPYFIKMQVNRNPYYLKFDDGVKQTNLRKEDVLKCPLQLPCLVEQEKIANFLTSLDNVLQEEKNYLEYLKTIKKGLLQQMFV